jgi:hypothetical protein
MKTSSLKKLGRSTHGRPANHSFAATLELRQGNGSCLLYAAAAFGCSLLRTNKLLVYHNFLCGVPVSWEMVLTACVVFLAFHPILAATHRK